MATGPGSVQHDYAAAIPVAAAPGSALVLIGTCLLMESVAGARASVGAYTSMLSSDSLRFPVQI
jgi:hypothetical protein